MSKRKSSAWSTNTGKPLIPLQIKLREETREKLKKLAELNGLSLNATAGMVMSLGLPIAMKKLDEIHRPEGDLAAA